jgi:hypothetical protein
MEMRIEPSANIPLHILHIRVMAFGEPAEETIVTDGIVVGIGDADGGETENLGLVFYFFFQTHLTKKLRRKRLEVKWA